MCDWNIGIISPQNLLSDIILIGFMPTYPTKNPGYEWGRFFE